MNLNLILKILQKIPFVPKRPSAPKIIMLTQSLPTAATRTLSHGICKRMMKIDANSSVLKKKHIMLFQKYHF